MNDSNKLNRDAKALKAKRIPLIFYLLAFIFIFVLIAELILGFFAGD